MAFRVGQRVVCVNDKFSGQWRIVATTPKLRSVYEIREVLNWHFKEGTAPALRLVEIVNPEINWSDAPQDEPAFAIWRFRPVVEGKTDAGMAILEQIRRDVTNKELRPICHDEQV